MYTIIKHLIVSYRGHTFESVGAINGYFDDPRQARNCANSLSRLLQKPVPVCGCSLTVAL